MSGQTTVELSITNATPGLIADIHAGNQIVSAAAEGGDIPFGVVVQRGTDLDNQALIGGDANGILGITARSVGMEAKTVGATALLYEEFVTMAIMQDGYIFATCVAGCSPGDAVKFVNATGALSAGAAVVGETVIDSAQWMETAAAGAVAKLRLDGGSSLTAGI